MKIEILPLLLTIAPKIAQNITALAMFLFLATALSGCAPLFVGGLANLGVASTEERSIGDSVDDSAISAEIQQYLLQSNVKHMFSEVTIRVHEGRVLLLGRTDNQKVAEEATRVSWQAHGVREVMNEIKTGQESSGFLDYANDNLIETQIETRLLADKNIKSANYTVEVQDGVAYLLGVAQDEKERNIAVYIASISKGVKNVVNYVRLKNDQLRLQTVGKPREQGVNRRRGLFD